MYQYTGKRFFNHQVPLGVTIGYGGNRGAVPAHTHDFVELVFILRGSTIHTIRFTNGDKVSYGLFPGDIFAIQPGESHGYHNSQNVYYYNIVFSPELIGTELPVLKRLPAYDALFDTVRLPRNKVHLPLHERNFAVDCLQRIIGELARRKEGYELCVKSAFVEFLVSLCRHGVALPDREGSRSSDGILRTISLFEEAPGKSYQIAELARTAAMSESLYFAKFRLVTGMSPMEYLMNLRLDKALRLLLATEDSIEVIAGECGFCDSNHFIKTFRARNGLTPARYRRQFHH